MSGQASSSLSYLSLLEKNTGCQTFWPSWAQMSLSWDGGHLDGPLGVIWIRVSLQF